LIIAVMQKFEPLRGN